MKRTILSLITIVLVGSSFAAYAQQNGGPTVPVQVPVDSPQYDKVAMLLSAYHELPAKAQFEQVADVRLVLSAMAEDASAPLQQKRALVALGYWADSSTLSVYARVLSNPQTRNGTRHQLLLLTGKRFPTAGVPLLEPYLAANDLQLRLTAVEALAASGSDDAFATLERHAKLETNPLVLKRIEQRGSRLR